MYLDDFLCCDNLRTYCSFTPALQKNQCPMLRSYFCLFAVKFTFFLSHYSYLIYFSISLQGADLPGRNSGCQSRYIPFTMTWLHEKKQMKVYIFNHTQEHFSCVPFFFAIYLQTLQAVLRSFLLFFQLHCTLSSKYNCNMFGRKHFTSLSDVLRFDIEHKVSPTSQSKG